MPGLNVRFHVLFDATPGLLSALGGRHDDFKTTLEASMSQISDAIAEVKASLDAAEARSKDDFDALSAQNAALQAKIDAGEGTAQDVADLKDIKARLDAFDPDKTNPPVTPPDENPVEPPSDLDSNIQA